MKPVADIFDKLPLFAWILLGIVLFSQSLWLFTDSRKRGEKPWIWGIAGLINFPTPLIIYLFLVRKLWKNKKASIILLSVYIGLIIFLILTTGINH